MPITLDPSNGVRLKQHKEQSYVRPLLRLRMPETIAVPLYSFGVGAMIPIPRVGETVARYSMLARSKNGQGWVVSPVSGRLRMVERMEHPMVGSVLCAVLDVKESIPALGTKGHNPSSMTAQGIIQAARLACIVDEVDGLPLYYKLMKAAKEGVQLVVADAIDDTPYISSALKTVAEFGDEACDGVGMALKALDGGKAILAAFNPGDVNIDAVIDNFGFISVVRIDGGYPAWSRFERERLRGRKALRIGVQALRALSLAVRNGIPQTESIMTICGDCVENPANVIVPNGVSVEYILKEIGLKKRPEHIILGDTMCGFPCTRADVPVFPGIRGICAMSKLPQGSVHTVIRPLDRQPSCVNCGRCVEVCPRRLFPSESVRLFERGVLEQAKHFGASDCDGCGACSAVCPAGIEVSEIMLTLGD